MKSIKEKALEHGLLNPVIHYDADGNTYDDHDKPSNDFEEGANYVLEQIESILPFVAKKGIIYGKIKKTIEQLKSIQQYQSGLKTSQKYFYVKYVNAL